MIRKPALISCLVVFALVGTAHAQSGGRKPAKPVPVVVPPQPAPRPVVPTAPPTPDLQRTAFIAEMDGEYRKRDADGDGKVTRAEIERWERNVLLVQAQANNRALFARLDADRNGVLSPGEFAALVQDPGTPDVAGQMQRFDGNRDQVISLVEWRVSTLANFDRLDADKDGVLTGAEVQAGNVQPQAGQPQGR